MVFCTHCGIRFLTHPRCAGRRDLRCPFGCRQHHRRQRSNQRSAAYYRTPSGKELKEQLNARRGRRCQLAKDDPASKANQQRQDADEQPAVARPVKAELRLEDQVLGETTLRTSSMLGYVGMIVNLLEGIRLHRGELLELLLSSLRQHSIAYRTRTDYVLRFLYQHPP